MKKPLRILLFAVIAALFIIIGIVSYVSFLLPNVGEAENITIERTPERIERGRYLANYVTVCVDCHSTRDYSKYAAPPIAGTEGQGGECFDQRYGFPGTFYSKNITPYALSNWTDGEIFRAITTGVNKNGKALFPVMPYHYYGQLDREDLYSIIAYLRTIPSIKNDIAESKPDFPFSIIGNLIPKKANCQTRPAESDTVAYGKYLLTASGCAECHTKDENGQIIPELILGGGRAFSTPAGILRSPNLTPHEDGLKEWTAELFVGRFKMYEDTAYHSPTLTGKDLNTIMPWTQYSKMKESDLRAIFRYLQTVKPIAGRPVVFEKI